MGLQDENRESFDDALAKANDLERKKKEAAQNIPPLDLTAIDIMDAPALRILIRKVAGAIWGYGGLTGADLINMALKTKDEAYESLKLTALTLAVNAKEWREFSTLATFWCEREKGKPSQSIDVSGKIGIVEIVLEAAKQRKEQNIIDITPEK